LPSQAARIEKLGIRRVFKLSNQASALQRRRTSFDARDDSMTTRSKKGETMPCAISIAGLDPGGGAGILADMRAFAAAKTFGCAVTTVLTVQSTSGIVRARSIASREWIAALDEVVAHQNVRAMKSGALGNAANVRALAGWANEHAYVPLVVDPVMIASRVSVRKDRARLLDANATRAMKSDLLPRAWLVTANAHEASTLTSLRVTNAHEAEIAARAICEMGARAALVKGGHLKDREAIDVLVIRDTDRETTVNYVTSRIPSLTIHGAGCTLASLIAGKLAHATFKSDRDRTRAIIDSVRWAKRVHHRALTRAKNVGGTLRVLTF
jgi:hydroxymethylpyrimidine kinase/phosphomethylpyrimidine kinase